MEISSRKIRYYNNIPVNYYNSKDIISKYNLVDKILTDEEIELDLKKIINLCDIIFNKPIKLHIIPHLNLKTKVLNDYIPERNALVNLLECLSNKYDINIHNIGKYIESINTEPTFLEEYMADSTHYSKDYKKITEYLTKRILVK